MSGIDRFDGRLGASLLDVAAPISSDYLDDVLAVTARTRQRPAWTFPGRWLPMTDLARRQVFGASIPWRPLAIVLIVAALAVAAAAAFVGSRGRLPAPFGVARNGLIAYADGGDIYTYDPATGASQLLVGSPDAETGPVWSLDGTRLAFVRQDATSIHGRLFVVGRDGGSSIAITPEPTDFSGYAFSPSGDQIAFTFIDLAGGRTLAIANVDGTHLQMIDVGMRMVDDFSYRPRDGREILFLGRQTADDNDGLYAVEIATGTVRTIVAPSTVKDIGSSAWSPDGSAIAYTTWDTTVDYPTAEEHIIAADGTGDRTLGLGPDATWHSGVWSNDGTRLVVFGVGKTGHEGWYGVVVRADGGGTVTLARPMTSAADAYGTWSPDDRSILGTPRDAKDNALSPVVWDALTGAVSPAPYDGSWQRLAP